MNKRVFIAGTFSIAVILIIFLGCQASSKASSSRLLKFNMQKDKVYNYELVWDIKQTVFEQESKISVGSLYSIKVNEDDGHIKTLTGTYKNFKMSMNMMGMDITIDSDKPLEAKDDAGMDKNPVALMKKVFSGISGKSFIMKVDEEGNIIEVSGFEEMYAGMMNAINLNEDQKAKGLTALKNQFNEKSVKDQFAQLFTIYPNKEIKTGDTWERNYSSVGNLPAKYSTTYTVKGIEGDHVTLVAKTKIGSTSDIDIKGEQQGNIIIDSKSGLIINAQYEQNFVTTVKGTSVKMEGKGNIKGTLQ